MYWNILKRSIERGQDEFDFGRSTPDGPVYRFKAQWDASPSIAQWQFYARLGGVADMRPDSPKFRVMTKLWRSMPVGLTRLIGPTIVRGIP